MRGDIGGDIPRLIFEGQRSGFDVPRRRPFRHLIGAGDARAARPRVGVGRTVAGRTPAGTAPPFVLIVVDVSAAFGLWKFAAVAVDGADNVPSDPVVTIDVLVSATDPEPLTGLAFSAYDSGNNKVTFDWS